MIKVYTANIGEKDTPRSDIECFSGYSEFKNPNRNAKIYKVLPHLFMDVEYSIWIDANIDLLISPEEVIGMMTSDTMVFIHGMRDCLYNEAIACIECGQDDPSVIKSQTGRYRRSGVKEHLGLAMCGVIARRHTKEVERLNEKWWAEICRGSTRDQISFPVVFPSSCIKDINPCEGIIRINDHL